MSAFLPPKNHPKKPEQSSSKLSRYGRFFTPILAGATWRSRLLACIGAFLCVLAAGLFSGWLSDHVTQHIFLVAPVGASAMLLFVVPASPMAQPWAIIGGNMISALVAVSVAYLVQDPLVAAALALALAIAAMSMTYSLHPPGGAVALTAVLGGTAVQDAGFMFPLLPVAVDSIIVVICGVLFHRLTGKNYPHKIQILNPQKTEDTPAQMRGGPTADDIDAALAIMDESFDIHRQDLDTLLRQIEMQSLIRTNGKNHAGLTCDQIMSRHIITIDASATQTRARALLISHNIRSLPVVDAQHHLLGTVGVRDVLDGEGPVSERMQVSATALRTDPAISLLPVLTDGRSHAVVIVDPQGKVEGLISQTDLLAALARLI